jgi:hypothetical protein
LRFKEPADGYPIVLTTPENSLGHDFFFYDRKVAKVIMSKEPKTLTELNQ